MGKLILILFAAIPNSAHSQIVSGTIVIVQQMENKLIVVADSRAIYGGGAPPSDMNCKISTFGHQFVFSTSGTAVVPAEEQDRNHWSNAEVARDVYRLHGNRVGGVAINWLARIEMNWRGRYLLNPAEVAALAEKGDGTLTNAFFAGVNNEKFVSIYMGVTFDVHRPDPIGHDIGIPETCISNRCAMGIVGIFADYLAPDSPLAKREGLNPSPEALERIGMDTLTDIRIADLTAAYEPKPGVGGPIDAVELWQDGSVHWVQIKDNCPENGVDPAFETTS